MRARWLTALLGALVLAPHLAHSEPMRIVLLPIVVHTAARDSAYVSRGLGDMLSARLEQVGDIEVVRVEDAGAATTKHPDAIARGEAVGGDYVIYGAFTQFGDGASLDVQCAPLGSNTDQTAAKRRIFIQSGSIGEIIPKLDALVDKVAVFVDHAPAGDGTAPEGDPRPGPALALDLRELRDRLDALERTVYDGDGAPVSPDGFDAETAPAADGEQLGSTEPPAPDSAPLPADVPSPEEASAAAGLGVDLPES